MKVIKDKTRLKGERAYFYFIEDKVHFLTDDNFEQKYNCQRCDSKEK